MTRKIDLAEGELHKTVSARLPLSLIDQLKADARLNYRNLSDEIRCTLTEAKKAQAAKTKKQ